MLENALRKKCAFSVKDAVFKKCSVFIAAVFGGCSTTFSLLDRGLLDEINSVYNIITVTNIINIHQWGIDRGVPSKMKWGTYTLLQFIFFHIKGANNENKNKSNKKML